MLNIKVRNVNQALVAATRNLVKDGERISSRGMMTIEYPTPVTTTYLNPRERVLFCPARDANPFFHFMESLWMLAGRRDVEWLSQFNSRIHEYSDHGRYFHAAYGYRLRRFFGLDQIQGVVELLKTKPDTRQAVMAIWSPTTDLNVISKDIPCNDVIFFKIRHGKLNMTVSCRSNDMLWGAYGANVVHFSIIQEYMANLIGVPVGVYNQVSDSFHVYLDGPGGKCWNRVKESSSPLVNLYDRIKPFPLIVGVEVKWHVELGKFMEDPLNIGFTELYFKDVAVPMFKAWKEYKAGNLKGAMLYAEEIKAKDWQIACRAWLSRRLK